MRIIADLHLHSRYSRAVSQQMVIPEIARWAKKKGIGLVGTSDWTHPLWLRELKEGLEEAGEGIYRPKSPNPQTQAPGLPYFILATEISSIYSQGGRPRRIHNLVLAPSFEVVEKINAALRNQGANLLSDGRPVIGLSSIQLCELVFSISKKCLVIPCHAWTPWYSLYGSRSGFDSLKECFGEFSHQIYAIETGLSSDPAMNWRIKELDNRSIVSFSDAHSPAKLGREATVFEIPQGMKLSYEVIRQAIVDYSKGDEVSAGNTNVATQQRNGHCNQNQAAFPGIAYTIEFYPEEGKYHYTGHRKCGVKQSPEETKKLGTTCPVCGKKLTIGVLHRVEELASRSAEEFEGAEGGRCPHGAPDGCQYKTWRGKSGYVMLVPLMEILAEALEVGVSSQTVVIEYNRLTENFGSEFAVLLKTPLEEIARIAGEKIAEGIRRMRKGEVFVDPGFDGVFGRVKIWTKQENYSQPEERKQMSLF